MKLYKNNILLGILLILLLIFSLCILSKNTVIENYGLEDCISQNPKIANRDTFNSIRSTLENCIREFKTVSSNPSMCNGANIIANSNEQICSGGEYGLGNYE